MNARRATRAGEEEWHGQGGAADARERIGARWWFVAKWGYALVATLVVAACGGSGGGGGGGGDEASVPQTPGVQYLFVQMADSGTLEPSAEDEGVYTLTLKGVRPTTTYFSDRPYRLSGYISTADFVGAWSDPSDDSFLKDPPNAALQIDGAGTDADVLIVELEQVTYDEAAATVKYRARVFRKASESVALLHAQGDAAAKIPASFGPASLFIDSWASKAWKKVKKAASDVSHDIQKDADAAAAKLKTAVASYEQAVKDTASSLVEVAADPGKIASMGADAFHRLISLALPSGLGKCISAMPDTLLPDPVIDSVASATNASWMEGLGDKITGRTLKELALPGSHDSGTYPITGTSNLSAEFPSAPNAIVINAMRPLFPQLYPIEAKVAGWSRAQRHTIAAQLQAGVRYFDLRMLPDPLALTFVATHGFAGAELTPMVNDLAAFLAQHPKEIVILDFQHMFDRLGRDNEMAGGDAEEVVRRLRVALGSKIIPHGSLGTLPPNMVVNDLWQAGQQVLVVIDNGIYHRMSTAAQQYAWSHNDVLDRYWPNKPGWNLVKDQLNQNWTKLDAKKIGVVQTQSTFDAAEMITRIQLGLTIGMITAQYQCLKAQAGIAGDLLDTITGHLDRLVNIPLDMSLQEAAEDTGPNARQWVSQRVVRHVVIADFIADYPDLIQAIIDQNK